MRIMIKGGVWKNTEDEILKAAVMKYGLNQWNRIASLLSRKSGKQCKCRWYEWLDPKIKKIEWSREEEEKLLHLAKLMPNQWRSIAPIVGRTAAQCLEHYEKLLDQAQAGLEEEDAEPKDDPRRLRPGEIDPNPESKPARPDPVDMDEDEKEMLSEARARLANTKGKKAKRKAREKQLEEARRLAHLQKVRELRAAGINMNAGQRRPKHGMDYDKEIPFQKKPVPGFYETSGEVHKQEEKEFRPVSLEKLEGKRRTDIEAEERKRDAKRQKLAKEKDMPSAIMKINALNDPEPVRKRTKLMMPTPQVTERELEEIARAGRGAMNADLDEDDVGATRTLVGNYKANSAPTPMRTPRASAGGDTILEEAMHIKAMLQSNNPLMGGESVPLHSKDFKTGVTPQRSVAATPNALLTPLRDGSTPRGKAVGMTPGRTPLRDELNINDDEGSADSLARERQRLLKRQLLEGLRSIPAPKNEYKVVMPDFPEHTPAPKAAFVPDAADVDAERAAGIAQAMDEQFRLRSRAVQLNLPRPRVVQVKLAPVSDAKFNSMDDDARAAHLIALEKERLLAHDAAVHPYGGKAAPGTAEAPALETLPLAAIETARGLIQAEVEAVRAARGLTATGVLAADAWDKFEDDYAFLPSLRRFGQLSSGSKIEHIAAIRQEFELIKSLLAKDAKKTAKAEAKLGITMGGYTNRFAALVNQLNSLTEDYHQGLTQEKSFTKLRSTELAAIPWRLQALSDEVTRAQERERRLQQEHGELMTEKEEALELLQAARVGK